MRSLALLLLLATFATNAAAQTRVQRRALLVGINDYSASQLGRQPRVNPPPGRDWKDLHGAVNDVEALRQMLILLYGFEERDIVALTNQHATRGAILQMLQQHLIEPTGKGDIVLFYFAGHGSQVRNTLSDEPDRLDESLVPADSRLGSLDIRDKELRPLFNAIVDKGAHLTVILDHCHSGSGARGLPTGALPRAVKPDLRDIADGEKWGPRPESRGALVLSATQDFEPAWETKDEQGKAHGAFSWALLRAMRDSLAGETAAETFLRARARLRAETPFQEPVMAGTSKTIQTLFLGARTDRRGDRIIVAVERVEAGGTVRMQGGWANGLAIGTELRLVSDPTVRLRVTAMIGLGRSEARAEPGRALPPTVKSGAILEVAGWAAPPGNPLRVWMPRVSHNAAQITDLARGLADACAQRSVRWLTDPTEATGPIQILGPNLDDAIAAVAKLPAGSSLFVQLPAPAAMVNGIDAGGMEPIQRAEDADYILVGRWSRRKLEYAWVRPGVTISDKRKTGLPLRTDWRESAAELRRALLRLRRIRAWNVLESPPVGESPYRLALRSARTGELAKDVVTGDEQYEVALRGTLPFPSLVPQRYVYVFVIDSYGRSTLLFPRSTGSVENRLPLALPAAREIRLGQDSAFEITPPYGVDTYFLLTTDEALPNPWVLEWDGVRTRAPQSPTPLEQLLLSIGSTSRSSLVATPTTWSLEKSVYESVPPPHKRAASVSLR